MRAIKLLIATAILLLGSWSCSDQCLNPNCKFVELKAPVILTSKSFDYVTCQDGNGSIWESSTEWNVAKAILVEGYKVGDTIINAKE